MIWNEFDENITVIQIHLIRGAPGGASQGYIIVDKMFEGGCTLSHLFANIRKIFVGNCFYCLISSETCLNNIFI